MITLSETEQRVYNEGERLIPGRTHGWREVRRHAGSYMFWREIILRDIERGVVPAGEQITIVDLGSGTGHGCVTLGSIPNTRVVGVDVCETTLGFAREHYTAPNVEYRYADLTRFPEEMDEYHYVVSRGVIEHVPDGLDVARRSRWTTRLLFDVPYDEPAGRNPHHVLSGIKEEDFARFPGCELRFQDLMGVVYEPHARPDDANMIMALARRDGAPAVGELGITSPYEADWSVVGEHAMPPPGVPVTPPEPVGGGG